MQPSNAYTRAFAEAAGFRPEFFYRADNLVPGDDRRLARRQFALDDVQIRAAHSAGVYANQNFAAPGPRNINLRELKRVGFHTSWSLKQASLHCSSTIHFESSGRLAGIKCLVIGYLRFHLDLTSMRYTQSCTRGWLAPRKLKTFRGVASWLVVIRVLLWALPAGAQNASGLPQITRAVSAGQFVSAAGRRAALLGNKEGQFEAWIYPLKVLRGLHIRFHVDGRILAAEPLARTLITRPESSTFVYSDASFQVRETLFVPVHEPGAIITFEVQTKRPLDIEIAFTPDFQLEWPANLGPSNFAWDSGQHAFIFVAQDHPYAALVSSPTAGAPTYGDDSRDSASQESSFLLGLTQRGSARKIVCIAGSLSGRDDASRIYSRLMRRTNALTIE